MPQDRLKKMPPLLTDEEAEAFLENEDLSEYDWSNLRQVNFRLIEPKEEVKLEIPKQLAEALKARAEADGLPYTQLISNLLQQAMS